MKVSLTAVLLLASIVPAQIPDGYYDSAQGLSGEDLQWALHNIIKDHNSCSYNYIWTAFYTTDAIYGDKVWDMYSDIPGGTPPYLYTLGEDQGGSASAEGEGYNREHSWPSSWYGGSAPMNTDLFHIVPSDIHVNARRANYPYAEVAYPTWTSMNGSRLGPSTTPGYTGIAFEPIDGYKGDFARNFFYMAARYKGEDAGWPGSPMASGANLEDWAVGLLLQWHSDDPVSEKEFDRNEAVYAIQGNRNPFIDHPEFAHMVYDPFWGMEGGCGGHSSVVCSPNPFSSLTVIHVKLPLSQASSSLMIFSVGGRLVADLTESLMEGEGQSASWDGTDNSGGTVLPGIYFVVLQSGEESLLGTAVLLR